MISSGTKQKPQSLLIGCSEEQEKIQHAVYGIVFLGMIWEL